MEVKIAKLLMEWGYTLFEAKETAKAVCSFEHDDLRTAVKQYINSGGREQPEVFEGKYSTSGLMQSHSFEYPAALIFIDWYRNAPNEAEGALQWMK